MALLEVRNLSVAFDTAAGGFFAVRGVDLSVDTGEVLAIVGESGSGKSVAMLAVMGLLPPIARVSADALRFEGRDLLALTPRQRRALSGSEIAMIFQEPVASLNPCFTVGFQIEETLRKHTDLGAAERRERAVELLTAGRHPRAARAAEVVPAPDVRRPVPAGDDRHRHRLHPEAADRRRADHRARRDHPEADPRPAAAAAGRARHGAGADHPRHGGGGRDRRPRRRPVQRPQDGGQRRGDAVREPEERLHARAALGAAGERPGRAAADRLRLRRPAPRAGE